MILSNKLSFEIWNCMSTSVKHIFHVLLLFFVICVHIYFAREINEIKTNIFQSKLIYLNKTFSLSFIFLLFLTDKKAKVNNVRIFVSVCFEYQKI